MGNDIALAATTLSRKIFIAAFLVRMTRTKANRELSGGLQVKAVKGGSFTVSLNGVAFVTAKDADSLFEYAFRSKLNYYVHQADDLRIAAYEMAA